MAMRDRHFHPSGAFGAALRKHKAAGKSDPGMRGEAKPDTDELGAKPEKGGSAGERPGKASHPGGTGKHDKHRIKGKVRHVHVRSVHGGHHVAIGYHGKGADGEHFHSSLGSAKKHASAAMDAMEPEEADSGAMAGMV
jgi:hypothetical protein